MKSLLKNIMEHPSLQNQPPVLVDIGASGGLHQQWKLLASYSICVAFDADTRDFAVSESENKGWKKLYLMNRLVAAKSSDEVEFYLTKSPYCSSSLHPDNEALKSWAFSHLFDIEKVVKIPAVDLQTVLAKIGLDRIDWYKTDSQGTDLRLFKVLGDKLVSKVIVAEFEPGIIDAYTGEDKLYSLMAFMDSQPFWMSNLKIHGSQRIGREILSNHFPPSKHAHVCKLLKTSPGWGEATYFNTFTDSESLLGLREYLLGWVFATIERQYGFAFEIAIRGQERFGDAIFHRLRHYSRKKLDNLIPGIPIRVVRKIIRKISALVG